MKPDFLTIALENVFSNKQDSLAKEQFKSLLELIKKTPHRELLLDIDLWCSQYVKEAQQKMAYSALKNNFFALWTHKAYTLDKEDLSYIEKYYPFLSIKEQLTMREMITQAFPSIALKEEQTKVPTEVTKALQEFRNGHIVPLQNFLEEQSSISSVDYERIMKNLNSSKGLSYGEETFLMKVECYEKVKNRPLYYIKDSDLEARPVDFERLWNHINEQARMLGDIKEHANFLNTSFSYMMELSSLGGSEKNIHSVVVFSIARIGMALNNNKADNAVDNTNLLFSNLPYFKNFAKKHAINMNENAFIHFIEVTEKMDEMLLEKSLSDVAFLLDEEDTIKQYYDAGKTFLSYYMLNDTLPNHSQPRIIKKI